MKLHTANNISPILYFSMALIMGLFIGCGNTSTSAEQPAPPDTTDVPSPPAEVETDVELWLTTADKSVLFEKQQASLLFSEKSNSYPTIRVDTGKTYQVMDGFGFALTGGSAYVINNLPQQKRTDLLRELFGTDSTHIGISYLRVSIGASDLSRRPFSYNDLGDGQTDMDLSQFDLGPDTFDLIPVLQEILEINPDIKILGSPWSAPVWMKTNNSTIGGSLKAEYYDVYAQYFVTYIKAMKERGITIDAITPQNEPLHDGNNPSMMMHADEQSAFIRESLGPALEKAGLDTKIIVWDHNADNPEYPMQVLSDAETRKFVDGAAFHLYGGEVTALSEVHDAYPQKHVYFTEQYTPASGSFSGDLSWHMRNLIIGATRNWSRNVLEWNLANNTDYGPHTEGGCDVCKGALTIGSSIQRNVSYYIIASASKFVRPGSQRIASNRVGNLYNVAFKVPNGDKVLIVFNNDSDNVTFNIRFDEKVATPTLEAGAAGTFIWK